MLLSRAWHETGNNQNYTVDVYEGTVIIEGDKKLTLDIFDIESLMGSLFSSLNPEQRKNMIGILQKSNLILQEKSND